MIKVDFQKFVKSRHPTGGFHSANREDWKAFSCHLNSLHPTVIEKSKGGNGTHTDVMGWHFQSTASFSLYVSRNPIDGKEFKQIGFCINYPQIREIEYDTENKMIVFNGLLAIK